MASGFGDHTLNCIEEVEKHVSVLGGLPAQMQVITWVVLLVGKEGILGVGNSGYHLQSLK